MSAGERRLELTRVLGFHWWRSERLTYRTNVDLMEKVLDFLKSGGPRRTDLRTFRWEVVLKGLIQPLDTPPMPRTNEWLGDGGCKSRAGDGLGMVGIWGSRQLLLTA